MDIFHLPGYFGVPDSDIQIFDYTNTNNLEKGKINLGKHTISFLKSGTKRVHGQDIFLTINSDQFLIMKSGHCLMTEHIPDGQDIYNSILLFFSNESLLKFLEKYHVNLQKSTGFSIRAFESDDFIRSFVASLASIMSLDQSTKANLLNPKFEELMLYLVHTYGTSFLSVFVHQRDDRTSRLSNIVETNRHNKLSLEELAFLSNMSISTFKRAFYEHYNQTPMRWFNEQRLIRSAHLLRSKTARPIDLYENAGYESFSNFVQAFKRHFGVTPKQYQMQG